jgi:hypothetical protein
VPRRSRFPSLCLLLRLLAGLRLGLSLSVRRGGGTVLRTCGRGVRPVMRLSFLSFLSLLTRLTRVTGGWCRLGGGC